MENQTSSCTDEVTKHLQMIQGIRENALSVSCKADKRMIKTSMVKNPSAHYDVGDDVIVRRFSSSAKRKSAKDKQRRFVKGTILKYSEFEL